jgi:ketosteroid isomerase-like protein
MSSRIDSMMQHFVPGVVVHYDGATEGLFRPGVGKGRDALCENIRHIELDYAPLDSEILDMLVENEKTAVRWRGRWRHRGTGCVYALDIAHFLRWEGGLIVEMFEFFDHHRARTSDRVSMVTFQELLTPKSPGLAREEIERRSKALVNFSPRGPDVAQILELCAPGVVCEFVGDRTRIPYAGRHVGVEALANIVRAIGVDFEQLHCAILESIVDGGSVAVRRTVKWRHRGTGRKGLVELADFVRFGNGLIVELVEFRDSITLLEMQGDM